MLHIRWRVPGGRVGLLVALVLLAAGVQLAVLAGLRALGAEGSLVAAAALLATAGATGCAVAGWRLGSASVPAPPPLPELLTDPGTGFGTTHRLAADLPGVVDTARRHGRPLAVVHVGLEPGPCPPEDALQTLVAAVQGGRPGDLAYRLDDGEVLLVLPETGIRGGSVVAERLRLEVDRRTTGARASIGLAFLDLTSPDPESLLERAGLARRAAQRRGGNLVVEASDLRRGPAVG